MSRIILAGLCALLAIHSLPAQTPADRPSDDVKKPALAKELARRVAVDQAARKDLTNFMAANKIAGAIDPKKTDPKIAADYKSKMSKVLAADRDNTQWLKEIIAEHGWPGKSLVGTAGAQNAWLLVQHADRDRDFQESCLKKMEAMPKGEVEPKSIAYLTDRVLVGRGKKQKYGTQAVFKDGKAVAAPIEDPDQVDELRKSVGLQPLAEYLKLVEQIYKTPTVGGVGTAKDKNP